MAITWTVVITPISLADNAVSVAAVATDDVDGSTINVDAARHIIDPVTPSAAINIALMNELLAKYNNIKDNRAAVVNKVAALEAAAVTYLEANV